MDDAKSNSPVDDRIWITSRVRMVTEKRAKRNNFLSLVLLTYYSLFAVMIAIFSDYYQDHYGHFGSISIAASVAVLVASLVVSGFGFERTAWLHRECYLSLQKLHGMKLPQDEKLSRYNDVLNLYPNQSVSDYYDFLVHHTLLESKKVWNDGVDVKYTKYMVVSFLVRKLFLSLFVIIAIGVPVLFFSIPIFSGHADEASPAIQEPLQ